MVLHKISDAEFEALFDQSCAVWASLGHLVNKNEIRLSIVRNDENVFGQTYIIDKNLFGIKFNLYLYAQGAEVVLFNTMLHELGHYFQLKEALKEHLIEISRVTGGAAEVAVTTTVSQQEAFIYYMGYPNETGHSAYWRQICLEVDKTHVCPLPITPFVDREAAQLFQMANQENFRFQINCDTCGYEEKFLVPTNIVKSMITGKQIDYEEGEEPHCPRCKSRNLKFKYLKNPKQEEKGLVQ